MYRHKCDDCNNEECHDDSAYDEMKDDFVMIETEEDKQLFIKRYGKTTYDMMIEKRSKCNTKKQ